MMRIVTFISLFFAVSASACAGFAADPREARPTAWLSTEPVSEACIPADGRAFVLDIEIDTPKSSELPDSRAVQWLVFEWPGCAPCAAAQADFRPWLSSSGWTIGPEPSAHIRLIGSHANEGLREAFRVDRFPTFVLVANGKVIERHNRYPGKHHLAEAFNSAQAGLNSLSTSNIQQLAALEECRSELRATAAATASSSPLGEVLQGLRSMLGNSGEISLAWNTPGQMHFEWPIATHYAVRASGPIVLRYQFTEAPRTGLSLTAAQPTTVGLHCTFAEGRPTIVAKTGVAGFVGWQQPISGFRIDGSRIAIELPRFPDITVGPIAE